MRRNSSVTVVGCGFICSCHPSVICLLSIHPSQHCTDDCSFQFQRCGFFIHEEVKGSRRIPGGFQESSRRVPGTFKAGSRRVPAVPRWNLTTVPAALLNLPGFHGNAASLSNPNSKSKRFFDVLFIQDYIQV